MSHIRKGIIVWYHSNSALKKKIQACSNKFLRIIFFLKPRDSVRELMKEHKLLSVQQIFNVELAKVMQKQTLGTLPAALSSIFIEQTRLTQIQSRSATQVSQPPTRFIKCEQSIRCTGPKVWNSLPNDIKYKTTDRNGVLFNTPIDFVPFKSAVKKYALSNIDFI